MDESAVHSLKSAGCTEEGEALTPADAATLCRTADAPSAPPIPGPWLAVWTHSHCEQTVHEQLTERGYHAFLPMMTMWSRRRGVRRLIPTPMFPGYLFLRHDDAANRPLEWSRIRGAVRALGERWDRPSIIPEHEIDAIERLVSGRQRVLPFPYLTQGQRMRIVSGPLAGVEGLLVESRSRQGLLVLSVNLLQRSVAVVVDGTEVVPA